MIRKEEMRKKRGGCLKERVTKEFLEKKTEEKAKRKIGRVKKEKKDTKMIK